MNKKNPAFFFLLVILTIFAIKGLIVVSQFLGYATFAGDAGVIYELVVQHEIPTVSWAAVFGVAVRVPGFTNTLYEDLTAGDLEESNLLFDCMESDIQHEVYATLNNPQTLDLTSLIAATPAEVDAYWGKDPTDFDSATNTFTSSITWNYGTTSITAPGTSTFKLGEDPPATFQSAIAKTSNGSLVYVSLVTNFTDGFNGRLYNYQMLLPLTNQSDYRFYFFTDPNDVCPEGEDEGPGKGLVYGNVTDTNGNSLANVIVDVAGVTNLTDAQGQYYISTAEGNHNIWAILTGYEVYQNNLSVIQGGATRHDIVLEEEVTPTEFTNVGPGEDAPGTDVGPGQDAPGDNVDVGPGEAPLVPIVQQPQVIEGQDYIVAITEIKRKLRLGQFLQERIFIYSFKSTPATVTFDLNSTNLDTILSVDSDEITIEPDGQGMFIVTIFGVGETGIFNGTILLDGDINATIPVEIEILPKEQLPVEALHLEIDTSEKRYYPGNTVRVKTDLRNMIVDQQYPVRLLFTAQSPDGNQTLWTYETNVFLKTAFSLIKSFEVPKDTKSDDYIIRVTASYLDLVSGSSTIFHVAVPFWQRSLFGLKYWLWILIIIFLSLIPVIYIIIKRRIEAKKKYHLKVDYNELPKPGPRSIYVGKIAETDKTTYFKLENFKVHTIVAGSTGGGKSVSAQVIVEEALDKGVAVIAFDPTAQWTGMLRACKDKTMLGLYPLYGMKKQDAKAFSGNIRQINNAREKIDIKKYAKPGEIQVFACHKLDPKDMDILVANAIREIFHGGPKEEKLLKILIIFDEVHRLLPKFGGSGDGFLQIERCCREFRKWGMGILLVSQVLSDFMGTIKANINTEIQMRTRDEGDLERIRVKYGEDVLRSLVKATVGTGMVENPAYNRGQPYFVAFKPLKHSVERLTDEEIEQYTEYNDKIDNLYYSLDQLEKEGVDVFDLRLEIKLALDKVKSGNFNMVKIYLEGLTPRIAKQWEKIGKKPQELVRELVDMEDIKAELAKAKEERDKYVKDQGGDEKKEEKKEIGWKDDVSPDQILNLKNGMMVINLASLYDEVTAMKDKDLPDEFDPVPEEEGKQPLNHFADWVKSTIKDENLANAMYNAKTKEELVAVLDKKKAGEKIDPSTPPAWVGGAAPAAPAAPAAEGEKPAEAKSEEKPAEGAAPADAKPAEGDKSAEVKPKEAKSQETKPAQGEKPPEEKMEEAKPEEKPAQAKPEENKPAEGDKLVEAKPTAAQPQEAQSAAASTEAKPESESPKSVDASPAKEKPAVAPSSETKPEENKPVESENSAVTKSVDPKPSAPPPETKPETEAKPAVAPAEVKTESETKPAQSSSADAPPVETKPQDSKPQEAKPVEEKPQETQPVAQKPTATNPTPTDTKSEQPATTQEIAATAKPVESTAPAKEKSDPATQQTTPANAASNGTPQEQQILTQSTQSQSDQTQTNQKTTKTTSLDDLVVSDEQKAFHLEDGKVIHGLKELKDYLPAMDEALFSKHVGQDYNHFADWVQNVFQKPDIADKLNKAHTKEEMLTALS